MYDNTPLSDTPTKKPPAYLYPINKDGLFSCLEYTPKESGNWPVLEEIFHTTPHPLPLLISPLEFQLESLYGLVCKQFSIPAPIGNVYNLPICREIINLLQPNILITNSSVLTPLLEDLTVCNVPISFTTIVLFDWKQDIVPSIVTDHYPHLTVHETAHPLLC